MSKRTFKTGANRNSSDGKFAYKDFINPLNEYEFAKYMHGKRLLKDGTYRDGDNWQRGIDKDSLLDSLTRHVKELELLHMGYILIQYEDENGEHTEVIGKDDLEYMQALLDGFERMNVPYHTVQRLDVLNAIRFNSEAYKLQELGYLKKD